VEVGDVACEVGVANARPGELATGLRTEKTLVCIATTRIAGKPTNTQANWPGKLGGEGSGAHTNFPAGFGRFEG